ncbi:MAG: hypothetical protein NWR12_11825 [Haliea sp.]|nr:hypothetical protein [Haliea sp.]
MLRPLSLVLLLCLSALSATAHAHPGHEDQLKAINQALAKAPENQALYLQRAAVYGEIGHFDEAEADFAKARTLGAPWRVDLAESIMQYGKGDLEEALALANHHVEQFPDDPQGFRHRAMISRDAGDHASALADLQTYFKLRARPSPGLFVAAANMLVEAGRTEDAIAVLDQGLQQLGMVPQLQRQALNLELASGRPAAAVARQETLRSALRDSASWKLHMVDLLLQAGRQADARALLTLAQEQLTQQRDTPSRKTLEERAGQLAASLSG